MKQQLLKKVFYSLLALCALYAFAVPAHSMSTIEIFKQGSPLRGANGVLVDGEGRLAISSVIGREIVLVDTNSGAIVERIGSSLGVETPDDIAFGPDGSIYWTALLVGQVGRLSPLGELTIQAVDHSVNSIAVSPDGRVFVSQCGFLGGSNLYELDPDLQAQPRFITDALGVECGVNGMAVGPDGFLYGPRFFRDDIVRIDPNTGDFSVVAEGFDAPSALRFGPDGQIYVSDFLLGQVIKIDPQTGDKTLFAQLDSGLDSLAVDAQNRVFVSNNVTSEIVRILQDGTIETLLPPGLAAPGGLAMRSRGNGQESLFVADFTAIVELDSNTGQQLSLADSTFRAALDDPATLFYDGKHFIVTAWSANSVQVWDARNEVLLSVPDFQLPLNAIRFRGDLIVAELGTGSVVRASGSDVSIRETLIEGLVMPTGLAATDDDLYVADWFQGAIWQIFADGVWLEQPRVIALGLAGPEGLTVDHDGNLLVVESAAGRLSRVDPETREVLTVATGLNLGVTASQEVAVPTVFFSDVEVGTSGDIYVSGDVDSVIYRIRERPNATTCVPSATTLCLQDGHFQVNVSWTDFAGGVREALVFDQTEKSGSFYFNDPENWEILAKVLDGCDFNGHYWFFSGNATTVSFEIRVQDTLTGEVKIYRNPSGQQTRQVADQRAFSCR